MRAAEQHGELNTDEQNEQSIDAGEDGDPFSNTELRRPPGHAPLWCARAERCTGKRGGTNYTEPQEEHVTYNGSQAPVGQRRGNEIAEDTVGARQKNAEHNKDGYCDGRDA